MSGFIKKKFHYHCINKECPRHQHVKELVLIFSANSEIPKFICDACGQECCAKEGLEEALARIESYQAPEPVCPFLCDRQQSPKGA